MPTLAHIDSLTSHLRSLRVVPDGVVAARPGVPLSLAVAGLSPCQAAEAVGLDVSWDVMEADGAPAASDAFDAPLGLGRPEMTVVFPTQLRRTASFVPFVVGATVRLTAVDPASGETVATPPTRLAPVTVHVAAMGPAAARALLTHLGLSLAAAGAEGSGLGVPVPPPALTLLGLPPVPVNLTVSGSANQDAHPTIRLSAHLPALGRVTTGPIPLPEREPMRYPQPA